MKPIIYSKYDAIRTKHFNKNVLHKILTEECHRWGQNLIKWFSDRGLDFIYKDIFGNIEIRGTNPDISQIMYDYCLGDNNLPKCPICTNKSKFFTFRQGYFMSCGKECCYNLINSMSKIGDKNPSHRMTDETRKLSAEKQSIRMKELILSGKFTPCITNSWANSRCKIQLNDCNYLFRSTWEAMFWLLTKYEYEKIRIPYLDKNSISHTYIVDFVDYSTKTIYEIKPSKLINNELNKIKQIYAKKWCKKNDYKMVIITEKFLKENIGKILTLTTNDKILKAIKALGKL